MPSLRALLESPVEVAAAVTNPDRPAGRGLELVPSPVKVAALEAGIPVLQPSRASDPSLHAALADLAPDVAVVVAYGKLLPKELLELPPLGFVNVHFSLLPAYRGAAPVQRAIMDGNDTTGVSIMVLTEGMDEGPVLATETEPIRPAETAGTLGERLAETGARLLVPTLEAYRAGLQPAPQDHSAATYAPKLSAGDARIDWTRPASSIRDLVRALNPEPGAWTEWEGRRLKIHSVAPGPPSDLEPGEMRATHDGLLVGTGDGSVVVTEGQLAGKRSMPGAELARGLRPPAGARLG